MMDYMTIYCNNFTRRLVKEIAFYFYYFGCKINQNTTRMLK